MHGFGSVSQWKIYTNGCWKTTIKSWRCFTSPWSVETYRIISEDEFRCRRCRSGVRSSDFGCNKWEGSNCRINYVFNVNYYDVGIASPRHNSNDCSVFNVSHRLLTFNRRSLSKN